VGAGQQLIRSESLKRRLGGSQDQREQGEEENERVAPNRLTEIKSRPDHGHRDRARDVQSYPDHHKRRARHVAQDRVSMRETQALEQAPQGDQRSEDRKREGKQVPELEATALSRDQRRQIDRERVGCSASGHARILLAGVTLAQLETKHRSEPEHRGPLLASPPQPAPRSNHREDQNGREHR
jgi:FtsZ-interacting cell division protein ZipA